MKTLIIYLKMQYLLFILLLAKLELMPIHAQEMIATTTANYTTFELPYEKNITTELEKLTPDEWKQHPDYGILPFYAPCNNCVELIHKRTDSTRYFIENNTQGRKIYAQTGEQIMHFRDENGYIRERLNFLLPSEKPHVFKTISMPEQIEINILKEHVAIIYATGKQSTFNKKLELWAVSAENKNVLLDSASWKNGYTAGKNGVRINDVFPSIDMEISILQEGIKTNFVVKNNNNNFEKYRYIFIKDNFFSECSANIVFVDQPNDNELYASDAIVYNNAQQHIATVEKGIVFDANNTIQREVFYKYENGFDIYVETDIFSDHTATYPIVIDPTIQLTSTLPLSSMSGSKYHATCWNPDEYCSYDLTVNFPANVTFTDVTALAGYSAPVLSFSCPFTGGAMRIVTEDCISPNTNSTGAPPPYFWKCTADPLFFNACHFNPAVSIFNALSSCLPPPACTPQTQIFSLQLFRCVQPSNNCTSDCITAYEPFIITIIGETLDLTTINVEGSNSNTTICQGDTIVLKPDQGYGVPTYSYLWTPNGETNDSIIVNPQQTTNYSVTVTDLCGNEKTTSKTITVIPVTKTTIDSAICETALPFTWENKTITTLVDPNSPDPYHILYDTVMQNGCPNTTELHLVVNPTVYKTVDTTVCAKGFPFLWNGLSISDFGTYLHTVASNTNCDSIITLNVALLPESVFNTDSTICEQQLPFIWNGQTILQSGNYTYVATSANGCDSTTILSLKVLPTLYQTVKEKVYEEDLPIVWFGNTISDIGFYVHRDTFSAQNSCDSIITTELTVDMINTKELFFVPNTFTPQGDGYNEMFLPTITEGVNVQSYVFEIYDRWGKRVFHTTDIHKGWDGQLNGNVASQGLYNWRIFIEGIDIPDTRWVIGHVNVLR